MWASLVAFDFLAYARGAACVSRQLVALKHASIEYEYHHSETDHAPRGGDGFEQPTPRDPYAHRLCRELRVYKKSFCVLSYTLLLTLCGTVRKRA